jgi:hypothetical protein
MIGSSGEKEKEGIETIIRESRGEERIDVFSRCLGVHIRNERKRNLKTNDTIVLSLSSLFSSINIRVNWSLQ